MRFLLHLLYRFCLPLFLALAAPSFVLKMRRRGGWNENLKERLGIYPGTVNTTRVLLQAVSVGETLVALKIVEALRSENPDLTITLAVGTATGRQLAEREAAAGVQVIYAPVDLTWMAQACLNAVRPEAIAFVEGECWPNFVREADKRDIPMALLSARLSPGSASVYERFPILAREQFSRLSFVGVADEFAAKWWRELNLKGPEIVVTGNVKYDPGSGPTPQRRPEFAELLNACCRGPSPVLLASSTHAGEESLLAEASMGGDFFLVIAPRHVERADEIQNQLEGLGWEVLRRSRFKAGKLPAKSKNPHRLLLIDTTGELRDWTAHAHWVVIGKTFVDGGGQSPVDAILAGVPVISGPTMNNFSSLFDLLKQRNGIQTVEKDELVSLLRDLTDSPGRWRDQVRQASSVLEEHRHSANRSRLLFERLLDDSNQ